MSEMIDTMLCVSKEDFEAELNKHKGEVRHYQTSGVLGSDGVKHELIIWKFLYGNPSVIQSSRAGDEYSYFFMGSMDL